MEVFSEDRYHYGESLQRIAHRDLAKTEMCGVADPFRRFARAGSSVASRVKSAWDFGCGNTPSWKMDCTAGATAHRLLVCAPPAELRSAISRKPDKGPLGSQAGMPMFRKNLTAQRPTRIFFGSGDFDSSCI